MFIHQFNYRALIEANLQKQQLLMMMMVLPVTVIAAEDDQLVEDTEPREMVKFGFVIQRFSRH